MAAPVGNQNAKKAKRWESALTRALAKVVAGEGVDAGLDRVAETVVTRAIAGDKDAWQEVANRLDGKSAQQLTVSGDVDAPLGIVVQAARKDDAV